MRGDDNFKINWPDASHFDKPKSAKKKNIPEVLLDELAFDEKLYDKLKSKRKELAEESGVPAYSVFSNQVLEFFTRLRPTSKEQALRIKGVGEVKAKRYLAPFIEVIQEHLRK